MEKQNETSLYEGNVEYSRLKAIPSFSSPSKVPTRYQISVSKAQIVVEYDAIKPD